MRIGQGIQQVLLTATLLVATTSAAHAQDADRGVVECAINGTVVARYDRAELVTEGRLASTDGVYGLRFGHNTDVVVRGLTIER